MTIQMLTKCTVLVATISLLSGCASTLRTYDHSKKEMVGIPVSVPALMKITETTGYEPAPDAGNYAGYCTPETNSRYAFMPLGERIYINFDSAPFGKGEFKLEFNDSGLLKVVSVNSDATAGVEQISGLIGTILPFLSAPKAVAGDARATSSAVDRSADSQAREAAQALKEKYCIKSGVQVNDIEPVR